MRRATLALLFTASAIVIGCSAGSPVPPGKQEPLDEPKPPSLAKADLFPARHREAVRNVGAYLAKQGEAADHFYATVEQQEKLVVFHLWHESAFLPENRGAAGNPGGKCRDVWYDPENRSVVKVLWWQ
jgi:hypothetical protein